MASSSALVAPEAALRERCRFINSRISRSPLSSSSSTTEGDAEDDRDDAPAAALLMAGELDDPGIRDDAGMDSFDVSVRGVAVGLVAEVYCERSLTLAELVLDVGSLRSDEGGMLAVIVELFLVATGAATVAAGGVEADDDEDTGGTGRALAVRAVMDPVAVVAGVNAVADAGVEAEDDDDESCMVARRASEEGGSVRKPRADAEVGRVAVVEAVVEDEEPAAVGAIPLVGSSMAVPNSETFDALLLILLDVVVMLLVTTTLLRLEAAPIIDCWELLGVMVCEFCRLAIRGILVGVSPTSRPYEGVEVTLGAGVVTDDALPLLGTEAEGEPVIVAR